jgi:hypothetical protein
VLSGCLDNSLFFRVLAAVDFCGGFLLFWLNRYYVILVKFQIFAMNGHINETAPPLVSIGEVKLVQVQIVVWFVRTCEVWILSVLSFCPCFCYFCHPSTPLHCTVGLNDVAEPAAIEEESRSYSNRICL